MNRQFASLLCLVILATMPACRKQRKEKNKTQQEEINTMIEINDLVEEEKIETKKSIIKF